MADRFLKLQIYDCLFQGLFPAAYFTLRITVCLSFGFAVLIAPSSILLTACLTLLLFLYMSCSGHLSTAIVLREIIAYLHVFEKTLLSVTVYSPLDMYLIWSPLLFTTWYPVLLTRIDKHLTHSAASSPVHILLS